MNPVLNNELFEAFANASDNIYVFVTDMKIGMTHWSKSMVEDYGLPGEFLSRNDTLWINYIHPDDREVFASDISRILDGSSRYHNCQYRARNKYGEYNWVECRGSVINDEEGNPSIFAGLMTRLDNYNKYDPVTHLLTGYELLHSGINGSGTLMVVGIDSFRKVNSQYGTSYGNNVLIYLSELLRDNAEGNSVYRFQGDEFVILAKNKSVEELVAVFDKVREIAGTANYDRGIASFSITGGAVEFTADEETTRICEKLELCFDYAKDNHAGSLVVYSDEIDKKIGRRKLISEELLKCIKDGFRGFRLVYQPILANTGDRVVACEALLRWKTDNEQIGNCYPDEFISILESNGGMTDVGYYVMREAIRQASVWQKRFKPFSVSFNVSYVQLEDVNFVPAIIEAIEKNDADPKRITVELTESILNVDTVKVKNSFKMLRDCGIKIALDDFGVGNSSFWMLHNIDVDIVKLDQSFIRKLDTHDTGIDHAIVESVGLMCNRIGCQTVAEGIETEAIWRLVSDYGFTGLQGYLFSRPIEVVEFEELLEKYGMK